MCSDLLDLIKTDLFVIDFLERGNSRSVMKKLESIQENLSARGKSYGLPVEQNTSSGPWPPPQKAEALATIDGQIVTAQRSKTWSSQDTGASHDKDLMGYGQGTYGTVDFHTWSPRQTVMRNPGRPPSQGYHNRIGLETDNDTAPLLANHSDAILSPASANTDGVPPPLSTETTLYDELDTCGPVESQDTAVEGAASSSSSAIAAPMGDQKGKMESHISPLLALFTAILGSCLSGRD